MIPVSSCIVIVSNRTSGITYLQTKNQLNKDDYHYLGLFDQYSCHTDRLEWCFSFCKTGKKRLKVGLG